jgi:hypothetical protein
MGIRPGLLTFASLGALLAGCEQRSEQPDPPWVTQDARNRAMDLAEEENRPRLSLNLGPEVREKVDDRAGPVPDLSPEAEAWCKAAAGAKEGAETGTSVLCLISEDQAKEIAAAKAQAGVKAEVGEQAKARE